MKNIIKTLKKAKKIALFSHANPDPDTIGSTLALCLALEKMNKQVRLFCDAEYAEKFAFLKCYDRYNTYDFNDCDLFVSVDVSDSKLMGKFEEDFLKQENTIKIDHHSTVCDFAKQNEIVSYSACAILVYEIIKKLKVKIDSDIATLLYFAICGDTGIFKNNNLDAKTFEVCSDLLNKGASFRDVYSQFFDKRTIENVLLNSSIYLSSKRNDDYKFVILLASKKDFEKYNVTDDESMGNISHTFLNCDYKIGVLLKEVDDGIKCSFRSKFEYDVTKIAEKFGGGGHKNAAGCKINDTLENVTKLVEQEIINYLKGENL